MTSAYIQWILSSQLAMSVVYPAKVSTPFRGYAHDAAGTGVRAWWTDLGRLSWVSATSTVHLAWLSGEW